MTSSCRWTSLIFSHAGEKDYREDEGLADAERRFGVPVTHAEIAR